jgi:hypothetical protein
MKAYAAYLVPFLAALTLAGCKDDNSDQIVTSSKAIADNTSAISQKADTASQKLDVLSQKLDALGQKLDALKGSVDASKPQSKTPTVLTYGGCGDDQCAVRVCNAIGYSKGKAHSIAGLYNNPGGYLAVGSSEREGVSGQTTVNQVVCYE